jgi:hypothetical protein
MTLLPGRSTHLNFGLVLLTLVAGCGEDKPQTPKL